MGTQFTAVDSTRTRKTSEGFEVPTRIDVPGFEYYGANIIGASMLLGLLECSATFGNRKAPAALADHTYGAITVAEARSVIMAARARFATVGPDVITAAEDAVTWANGLTRGNVTAGPCADLDGLRDRLETFASFVEAAAALGADRIVWS